MKTFEPESLIFPMPVLIIGTYDEDGNPNAMNAAWGGIHDTNEIAICLSTDHKTTKNINKTKCFTVSFATVDTINESDYFGLVSGDTHNKIDIVGFNTVKANNVNAPIITNYPVTLECKVVSLSEDLDTTFVIGRILSINAKEECLTDGKIDLNKLKIVSFNPVDNSYYVIGEKVAEAFSAGSIFFKI